MKLKLGYRYHQVRISQMSCWPDVHLLNSTFSSPTITLRSFDLKSVFFWGGKGGRGGDDGQCERKRGGEEGGAGGKQNLGNERVRIEEE